MATLTIPTPESCLDCQLMKSMQYRYGDGTEGMLHRCMGLPKNSLEDFGIKYAPKYIKERPPFCPLEIEGC